MVSISKRKAAEAKKKAVLSSADYKAWVYYRRQAPNPPSNYYRAYMIDKSLRAPDEKRSDWSKHPFEADWGTVDSPGGVRRSVPKPVVKQRVKRGKVEVKPKKVSRSELKNNLVQLGKTMSQDYGAPEPENYTFMPVSSRRSQVAFQRNRLTGAYLGSNIRVGTNTPNTALVVAAAAHEFGHHVHARGKNTAAKKAAGVTHEIRHGKPSSYMGSKAMLKAQYNDEVAAWKLAQPYINKNVSKKGGQLAKANWSKKYALTTYKREQDRDFTGPKDYTIHFGKLRF